MAGAPRGLLPGGKSGQQEQEPRLSREWEEAPRWSKMDQLAKELTAGKRLDGEDEEDEPEPEPDPDRSMRLSFRARAFGPRGPGLPLRRGWRPSSSSREDSVEAGLALQARGYPEEKKEEEGSANRRAEVGTGRELALARPGDSHTGHHCPCPGGHRPLESRPRDVLSQGLGAGGRPGSQWAPREAAHSGQEASAQGSHWPAGTSASRPGSGGPGRGFGRRAWGQKAWQDLGVQAQGTWP